MKYSNALDSNCSKIVTEWQERLKPDGPVGKKIAENFSKEHSLEEEHFLEFYRRICKEYPSTNLNARQLINHCADKNPPLTLKGPRVNLSDNEKLSRLELARKFLRSLIESASRPYNDYKELLQQIKKDGGEIEKKHFKGKAIGNKRGLVWCTKKRSIEQAEAKGDSMDDVRDRMGLSHYEKDEEIIEIIYDWKITKELRKPTVLDAGDNPYFSPCGKTESLGEKEGLPEMIHEKIYCDKIEVICYRGTLTRSAPRRF